MANSKPYGYYGNVYVPPSSIPYTPQPANVPFTEADRAKLDELLTQTAFYIQSADDILIRREGTEPNTFVLSTSGHPGNAIVVASEEEIININIIDGGYA